MRGIIVILDRAERGLWGITSESNNLLCRLKVEKEARGGERRRGKRRSGIIPEKTRRDGRVAEGGGLLNRYRVKSSIGGSNPPLSAILLNLNILSSIELLPARTPKSLPMSP